MSVLQYLEKAVKADPEKIAFLEIEYDDGVKEVLADWTQTSSFDFELKKEKGFTVTVRARSSVESDGQAWYQYSY